MGLCYGKGGNIVQPKPTIRIIRILIALFCAMLLAPGSSGLYARTLAQDASSQQRAQPYHGYYFKILKGQGPAAPMGELDYVVQGVMIGGFALVAAPA
jgi:hypothetical protein